MKINTCVTTKSFNSAYWNEIFKLIHDNLKLDCLPPKSEPVPSILLRYWNTIWKEKGNIGKEFLNPNNIKIAELQRIWEYTQIVASIYSLSKDNVKGKTIVSLGAGFEPCLFVFAKLGAEVHASDIYYLSNFWHPNLVRFIKEEPEIFCHYKNFKPDIKYINTDLRSKKSIKNLGNFDVIYSVSSLEHIFTSFRKKKTMFKRIVKHLKDEGILSFTTELITKFDKKRKYRIYIPIIINKLRRMLKSIINGKDINHRNIPLIEKIHNTKIISPKNMEISDIKDIFKRSFSGIRNLFRYNRRYDFYTIEELQQLIKFLAKNQIFLVEKIDWKCCNENPTEDSHYKGLYRTAISLTFRKDLKIKK